VASGLSLTFGVLRVLNFAHGSLYMLGLSFVTVSGPRSWFRPRILHRNGDQCHYYGCGGLVLETSILEALYKRGWPEQLLATYALILIITDLVKWRWGGEFLSVSQA
jgi:branched-subunit amino acid ABC-type transport system permease component